MNDYKNYTGIKIERSCFCLSIIFIMILMLSVMTGCKADDGNETAAGDSLAGQYTSAQLYDTISSSMTDLPAMTVVYSSDDKDDVLSLLSEIDRDKVIDYVFAYSMEGKPEEIAVIQVKNNADTEMVKKNLEDRIKSRQSSFSVYSHDEKELEKFQTAKVSVKSNYIMMITGTQASNGKYAFDKKFEK